jgi:hypothetical protein
MVAAHLHLWSNWQDLCNKWQNLHSRWSMPLLTRLTLLAALLAPPSPVNFWVMLALFKTLLALSNAAHSPKASAAFPVSARLLMLLAEPPRPSRKNFQPSLPSWTKFLLVAQSLVPRAPS